MAAGDGPDRPVIFTADFWLGAGERAIRTFAQSLAAALVIGAPLASEPWLPALGLAGTTTLFSLLTSIGNASFVAGRTGRSARRRARP